jgi:hypothetical protein
LSNLSQAISKVKVFDAIYEEKLMNFLKQDFIMFTAENVLKKHGINSPRKKNALVKKPVLLSSVLRFNENT